MNKKVGSLLQHSCVRGFLSGEITIKEQIGLEVLLSGTVFAFDP